MNNREQIAKNLMFAAANLIVNEDDVRLPLLTKLYWEAAVAFDAEFAHEPTINALVAERITKFEDILKKI